MIKPLVSFALLFSISSFAADAVIQADNNAINTACATDAATASCGGEVVGKGLLKCLHAYKKSHPEFKFSDACRAAKKQRHADKAAGK